MNESFGKPKRVEDPEKARVMAEAVDFGRRDIDKHKKLNPGKDISEWKGRVEKYSNNSGMVAGVVFDLDQMTKDLKEGTAFDGMPTEEIEAIESIVGNAKTQIDEILGKYLKK